MITEPVQLLGLRREDPSAHQQLIGGQVKVEPAPPCLVSSRCGKTAATCVFSGDLSGENRVSR